MSYYTPHNVKTQAKQSFSIVPMQLFFDKRLENKRTAQLAYVALAFFADSKTGLVGYYSDTGELVTPSCVKMAKILSITPSNFSAGLKLLKKYGWVRYEKRAKKSWVYYLQFPEEFRTPVGEGGYPAELHGLMSDDEYARVQASRAKHPGKVFVKREDDDLSDVSADAFNDAMKEESGATASELINRARSKTVNGLYQCATSSEEDNPDCEDKTFSEEDYY